MKPVIKRQAGRLSALLAAAAAIALLLAATAGCGGTTGQGGAIQVKGSDTMVNLAQKWAEEYMNVHPEVNIAVTGGGSGTGISAMINGTTDMADASRAMKEEEKQKAAGQGIDVVENKVALDGIAVVVSPDNPVTELTFAQLKDIFTGRVSDWSEVGGSPGPIVILSRESNSGTHVFFKEHVLENEEYASDALLMPSTQAIVDEVKQNGNAIGYVGLGYIQDGVKAVKVSKTAGSEAVAPSVEAVQSGAYPVSRPLYIYTRTDASQAVLDYLDWIEGPEGQQVVRELDFVPLGS